MTAERLARYAVSGGRTTGSCSPSRIGRDAAAEAEAEADAAEQRTTLALEWHDGTHRGESTTASRGISIPSTAC